MIESTLRSRFSSLPDAPFVTTIGTFDGVHRGHGLLLRALGDLADALSAEPLLITFEPLPVQILAPHRFEGRLTTATHRRELIATIDPRIRVVEVTFDQELAALDAETFVRVIADAIDLRALMVGSDFALGRRRSGDIQMLRHLGNRYGYALEVIAREDAEVELSSSAARRFVSEGDMAQATTVLGRYFDIAGEVVHGAQVGRTIGFPTANVVPPEGIIQVPDGIYASFATVEGDDTRYPAMTYIGTRPALNSGMRQLETHLLDMDIDLYGKVLATHFVERIRPDADFPSVDELVAQMHRDDRDVRQVLASLGGLRPSSIPSVTQG